MESPSLLLLFLLSILGLLGVYVVVRLATAAFFRSKIAYDNWKEKGRKNGHT